MVEFHDPARMTTLFLLTNGGHNAGIVSGPVHPRRRHRVRSWLNAGDTLPPEVWFDTTEPQAGSWWPVWQRWLVRHSSETRVIPRVFLLLECNRRDTSIGGSNH